jgi:integrase
VTETGQAIDLNNFRYRIWEPPLKKAELKYRNPYQACHTFATKSIREGREPLWISSQMGTSLEMLFKHYAIYFRKKPSLRSDTAIRKRTTF